MVYQLGSFLGGGGFHAGTVAGLAALALLVYLLVRKPAEKKLPQDQTFRKAA
jgi:hypothetical protein